MPAALCQASAAALGSFIVVAGGSTGPYTNAFDFATSNNNTVYVLNTGNNTWSTFTMAPNIDTVDRFNQAAASTGSLGVVAGGANFSLAALSNVSQVTQSAGTPTFTASTALAGGLSLPAVADVSSTGFFYLVGGSSAAGSSGTPADGDAPGTNALFRTSDTAPGAWGSLTPSGDTPAARSAHVFIAATPSGGTTKIYAIAGQDSGLPVTAIDEYTP